MLVHKAFHACFPSSVKPHADEHRAATALADALQGIVAVAATRHVPKLTSACRQLAAQLRDLAATSELYDRFWGEVLSMLLLLDPADEHRMSTLRFEVPLATEQSTSDTASCPSGGRAMFLKRSPTDRCSSDDSLRESTEMAAVGGGGRRTSSMRELRHEMTRTKLAQNPTGTQLPLVRAISSGIVLAAKQKVNFSEVPAVTSFLQPSSSHDTGPPEPVVAESLVMHGDGPLSCGSATDVLSWKPAGRSPTARAAEEPPHLPQSSSATCIRTTILPASFSDLSLNTFTVAGQTARVVIKEAGTTEVDGLLQVNQYLFLQQIGRGSQGEVFLAYDAEAKKEVAVKVVQRPGPPVGPPSAALRSRLRKIDRLDLLRREIFIMKQCHHRNILALLEVIDDEENDEIYLVLQYAKRGAIVKLDATGTANRTLDAAEVASVGRQLCAGLAYLHRHGIAHCDIKPENILVNDDGTPLLCDFGVSRLFAAAAAASQDHSAGRGRPQGAVGSTFAFLPPEAMQLWAGAVARTDHLSRSDNVDVASVASTDSPPPAGAGDDALTIQLAAEEADVWALGLSLYVMLCGRLPVVLHNRDGTDQRLRYAMAVGHMTNPFFATASGVDEGFFKVVEVLTRMLQPLPEDRCTAKEAHEAFRQLAMPFTAPNPLQALPLTASTKVTPIIAPGAAPELVHGPLDDEQELDTVDQLSSLSRIKAIVVHKPRPPTLPS